jgi:hypothetical protein
MPSGLGGATPEPEFSLEQVAPTYEFSGVAAELPTRDFSAPIEIAEPAWKYETMLPPAAESAGPTGLQPQLEDEPPVSPPDFPAEAYPEPPSVASAVTVTSLDSFSLDDATAGQVRFASEPFEVAPPEVVQPAPPEDEYATETDAPEPVLEAASTEESTVEALAEPAPPEPHAEPAEHSPAFDWSLIYSVVHKVVARMSPPLLPVEVVEEMARRLADEIAAEISSGSFPPQK